ncbi:hypothetical protein HQ563_05535, partial [bacterium]|nr:hypothetical protein [bacterium]
MMHLKRQVRISCLFAALALFAGHAGGQALFSSRRPLASNVIVPQTRAFGVGRRASVEITEVKVGVVILEQAATTTMDVSLRNPTGRGTEAELIVPVPQGAVVRGFT